MRTEVMVNKNSESKKIDIMKRMKFERHSSFAFLVRIECIYE